VSGHTPGPWRLSRERGATAETIHAENGSLLARVYLNPGAGRAGFANARLIAAAPDLLEAAKDAYAVLRHRSSASRPTIHRGITILELETAINNAEARE
jgi:hypothetical protein